MIPATEPLTATGYVTRCATCGGGVHSLRLDANGKSVITPCGHKADIIVKPNPRLARLEG